MASNKLDLKADLKLALAQINVGRRVLGMKPLAAIPAGIPDHPGCLRWRAHSNGP
jgi:hypothetical protein